MVVGWWLVDGGWWSVVEGWLWWWWTGELVDTSSPAQSSGSYGGLDMSSLRSLASEKPKAQLSPASWADLQKSLKEKAVEKAKGAKQGKAGAKKVKGGGEVLLDKNFLKREYSKAYHSEFAKHKKAGASALKCKYWAQGAGRQRLAEVRASAGA